MESFNIEAKTLLDIYGKDAGIKGAEYFNTPDLSAILDDLEKLYERWENEVKREREKTYHNYEVSRGLASFSYHLFDHIPGYTVEEILTTDDSCIVTANTYAHLQVESKRAAANSMTWVKATSLGKTGQ